MKGKIIMAVVLTIIGACIVAIAIRNGYQPLEAIAVMTFSFLLSWAGVAGYKKFVATPAHKKR